MILIRTLYVHKTKWKIMLSNYHFTQLYVYVKCINMED